MKTTIKAIALAFFIFAVGADFAVAQTKKKTTTRTKRNGTTIVKKTTTKRKPMTSEKSAATTTASGLIYQITERGTGAPVKAGDTVLAHYTGLLTSGFKFDSSVDRGEPIPFKVGAGQVIKGWDEAFQHLRVGDKAILTIPASIAYGERGAGGVIPPGATLIFIVEVVGVK